MRLFVQEQHFWTGEVFVNSCWDVVYSHHSIAVLPMKTGLLDVDGKSDCPESFVNVKEDYHLLYRRTDQQVLMIY